MKASKRSASSAHGARAAGSARATSRRRIDFSDIPELTDEQLDGMRRVGRPPLGAEPRKLVSIRLDPEVLRWAKSTADSRGVPYQSLINDILARAMKKAS